MNHLRNSASKDFWLNQKFTSTTQGITITDVISGDQATSIQSRTSDDDERLDHIKARCAAGDGILITIDRDASDGALQVDKAVFKKLFQTLGLDSCMLSLLRRSIFGLHQFIATDKDGSRTYNYYLQTDMVTILWLHNVSQATTRGIMIPYRRRELRKKLYGHTQIIRWMDFFATANQEYRALKNGHGLLWLASVNLMEWLEVALSREIDIVRQVEAITGHGPYSVTDEADLFATFTLIVSGQNVGRDKLDICSKQTGLSLVMLANARRQCAILRTMLSRLSCSEEISLGPIFKDRGAVQILEARLHAAEKLADYLSTRFETQMSVTFNLIHLENARFMKIFALATVLFLPATFLAAFFSMPAFASDQDAVRAQQLRVYFAIAIPCTFVVLILSYIFTHGRRPTSHSAAASAGPKQWHGETNGGLRSPADMEMIGH